MPLLHPQPNAPATGQHTAGLGSGGRSVMSRGLWGEAGAGRGHWESQTGSVPWVGGTEGP